MIGFIVGDTFLRERKYFLVNPLQRFLGCDIINNNLLLIKVLKLRDFYAIVYSENKNHWSHSFGDSNHFAFLKRREYFYIHI